METTNTNRARAIIGARLIVATAATVAAWSTGASATGLPSTDWPTCPATILVADGAPISCDLDGRQTLSLVHVNRATCDHAGGRFVIVPNRAAVCADVDY